MILYSKLTNQQKAISNKLEHTFIASIGMNQYDFSIALAFLLNKYKIKRVLKNNIKKVTA